MQVVTRGEAVDETDGLHAGGRGRDFLEMFGRALVVMARTFLIRGNRPMKLPLEDVAAEDRLIERGLQRQATAEEKAWTPDAAAWDALGEHPASER